MVAVAPVAGDATGGEGDRYRPPAGLVEQGVNGCRAVPGGRDVAEQFGGLLGVERQLGAGDLRRQAFDEQPARGQWKGPPRCQHHVQCFRGVANDGGDQLGGQPIRSQHMSVVDDQHHVLAADPADDVLRERRAEGVGRAGFSSGDKEVEASAAIDSSTLGSAM